MPAKKAAPKKRSSSLLSKFTEQIGHVKEKLIEEKNHLAHMASETVEAIKEKVHDLRAPKKSTKRKTVVKKAVKKAPVKKAKKTAKKVTRKKVAKKR